MIACVDRSEFLAHPSGRWIAGRSWLYFHRDPSLVGFVLWGKPAPADLEQLTLVLAVELGAAPHVSLVDVRAVTWVDPRGFLVLERYVRAHREALSKAVTRLALVRPGGMLGAVTAGFFGVTKAPYPVGVFEERRAAFEWLAAADPDAALAELARAERQAAGTPELLRDLRAWLSDHLEQADLKNAARAQALRAHPAAPARRARRDVSRRGQPRAHRSRPAPAARQRREAHRHRARRGVLVVAELQRAVPPGDGRIAERLACEGPRRTWFLRRTVAGLGLEVHPRKGGRGHG